ncbi:L-serine ammonia-lyase, iron-sulfur-dependent, subunit alpha [Staphylococcus sp. NRL 16/872]|uniref:L-serine ammonia-lyase, iron-sulfur-dependent, subunit alpha n=1 Tax=Staphylococcus sp. NRL 16/872 TaxID=2930131 RepID=UPI001FB5633F|nr:MULTISPECIES: L-serine ammonia-lyase, iron-sulfur-dependent, subunit alpha [unclassified Staphylococcus]MCJ1655566.1 L-serine ammonia-lyase, iron-sulfur-dependent, subunit alpha [Staphylococcus sp. NRL 21/187]MCJ1661395.1 L-serine ammonia-lyase, iron-sulfur-dependent, subunit alpha [Staphylococcus sp. NRL 18/288]MCJ1667290.1 L-serine ammonia-lyase, iron-sulfur-dependent, subunit alpha [Staphylococcus sp. NRL 19/737]WEN69776.1 L-serine ammonia-lyase, iron-sulfur-dependent, subunit alpha [Stap
MFDSIRETIDYAVENKMSFADIMIKEEMELSGKSREEVRETMKQNLEVMRDAVKKGTTGDGVESVTGYTGHDAAKIRDYNENNRALAGYEMMEAVKGAVATNEVNAAMGIICATPTAGSSGTIPGVLFKLEKTHDLTEDQMIDFLFVASLFGRVIANNASVAGATGGCQAEVGSASAMAAASAVAITGGEPEASGHAMALAISNLLGLVCDPVGGLVEIPCVMRNAIGSGNALISADLALAGVESRIPVDEVIEAMDKIGRGLPAELRETGLGGLAGTPTGEAIKKKIFADAAENPVKN